MPILAPATVNGALILVEFKHGKRHAYATGDKIVFRPNGERDWQEGEITKYAVKTGAIEIKATVRPELAEGLPTDSRPRHDWHTKTLLYPQGKLAKVCKFCGAIYNGLNDNNLCGGARAYGHTPKLEQKA
jgi:hypothetical protein